jgi:hypothetical protein
VVETVEDEGEPAVVVEPLEVVEEEEAHPEVVEVEEQRAEPGP